MIIEPMKYSGDLIHKKFAYRFFRDSVVPIGSIVAFRGTMDVKENLIDLEDSLENDFIWSDDAVNFCWEIPILSSPFGAVAYQRLFNAQIANILQPYVKAPIEIDGDDLRVHKEFTKGGIVQTVGKASVSITHVKDGVTLGHTGININAGKNAPAFAYSTNLTDEQAESFMKAVISMFYKINDDMFIASAKVQI